MHSVAQLFSSRDVLPDLDVRNKLALFESVGRHWEKDHGISATEVAERLNARERLGSTGLGQGIAIPHARIAGLGKAFAVVARPKAPIEFDSPDGKPVATFFVMLVPAQATEQHLNTLGDVAQMLADSQFRERLAAAKSQDEVYRLFAAGRGRKEGK